MDWVNNVSYDWSMVGKAKLPTITTPSNTNQLSPGSFRCGQIALLVLTLLTGAIRHITSHITCNTKKFKRRLKDRFNED